MKAESTAFVPPGRELRRMLEGLSSAEVVLLLQQLLRSSGARVTLAACEVARELGHDDPGVVLAQATFLAGAGELGRARQLTAGVLSSSPRNLQGLHLLAHLSMAGGDRGGACALLRRVAEASPEFPGAQAALAAFTLPGPHYREVLARVHALLRPATYLEIGVETGATLALAAGSRLAVGVDPEPGLVDVRLPPSARTYAMTSDLFFEREAATAFDGRPVDLAFIDGMHWFEYALRDFANAERHSSRAGTLLLHDCLPVTAAAASRERQSTFWVGDTWKVLECLLDVRPDLRVRVVPAPPSGLVVVRQLDPGSTVLRDGLAALVERYRDLPYPHVPGQWPERYGLVSNDEAGLAEALGA